MKNRYRALVLTGILCLAGCAAAPNGDEAAAPESEATAAGPPQSPRREVPESRRIPPQAKAPAAAPPQTDKREVSDSRRIPPQAKPAEPGKQVAGMTFGRGIAKGPADMTFMLNASVYVDQSVDGTFSYSANSDAGTMDIEAEITCATLDHDAARAWIGGKITRNGSTDPRFAGQPGAEVWMRVLDRNADHMQPLVSAPLLAGGKINNAADYCKKKPWSDEELYVVESGALAIFP